MILATRSGKTLAAARSAEELHASRVLVLVPSLDLLAQTEAAWRAAGRRGPGPGPALPHRRRRRPARRAPRGRPGGAPPGREGPALAARRTAPENGGEGGFGVGVGVGQARRGGRPGVRVVAP
ncbi:DEAD/DEAH box helicase family protein [Streptomyces sp. NPDC088915]|uniref:DEAD/DEAH box helicase family protein n=1 Tax=Streptomyces sp. NPDC088915 TaxID=3365912 RepID=UPI00380177B6